MKILQYDALRKTANCMGVIFQYVRNSYQSRDHYLNVKKLDSCTKTNSTVMEIQNQIYRKGYPDISYNILIAPIVCGQVQLYADNFYII